MSAFKVFEQGILAGEQTAPGVFPITLITEGVGSTGKYSREMLAENAQYFTRGTKSFIDHPKDPSKPWERSLTAIAGKLHTDARYVEENGVAALKSDLKVDKRWVDFVEEYKAEIGISVYSDVFGERDEDGKVVVEGFVPEDPYRSVDLVVAAGRGGRFDTMMESYRAIENSLGEPGDDGLVNPPDRTTQIKDSKNMELEEIAGKVDKLTESLAAFVTAATPILESLKPSEVVDPITDEAVEAIVESKLPASSRKVVLEAVRTGAAVEDAIKDQTERIEELRNEVRVSEGYVKLEDAPVTGDALELGKVFS